MKTTVRISTVVALLGAAPFAHAAATASSDGSRVAIFIFLGMCALIIVVQLLPIIVLFLAFVKALAEGKKETVAAAPAKVVIEK